MNLLHKVGLMSIKEHNDVMNRSVDNMNAALKEELEKRSMLVDEVLIGLAQWRFDLSQHNDRAIAITLEVPRSVLMGMIRAEPDISGFTLSRTTMLLKSAIQRAINQIQGVGHYGEDASEGSYL